MRDVIAVFAESTNRLAGDTRQALRKLLRD